MSAKTALKLGTPIHGAPCFQVNFNVCLPDVHSYPLTWHFSNIVTSWSISSNCHGALKIARDIQSKHPLPIINMAYCSRQMTFCHSQISEWLLHVHNQLQEDIEYCKGQGEAINEDYLLSHIADIELEARHALAMYGMLQGSDLIADDIGVLSIHGTRTGVNVCKIGFHIVMLLNH